MDVNSLAHTKGNLRKRGGGVSLFIRFLRRNDAVITDCPPLQRVGGLPAGQTGPFQRSFDHNPYGMAGKSRIQQLLFLRTGAFQLMEYLKFFPDEAALFPLRKHGVKDDDIRREIQPRQLLDAVSLMKMHAAEYGDELRVSHPPSQGVLQESGNDGISFIKPYLKTDRRQQKGVLPQPCGGIDGRQRPLGFSDFRGPHQKLVVQIVWDKPRQEAREITPQRVRPFCQRKTVLIQPQIAVGEGRGGGLRYDSYV